MSICKIISGALCLLLEKHNFKNLDDHYRVPIYMCVGSSMGFFLIYGITDIAELAKRTHHNWFVGFDIKRYTPAIMTNLLYLTMVCMGIFMGGGLGIVYGIADVEGLFEISIKSVYWETLSEIISLAPVGILIGTFFGFIFGVLRTIECTARGDAPDGDDEE